MTNILLSLTKIYFFKSIFKKMNFVSRFCWLCNFSKKKNQVFKLADIFLQISKISFLNNNFNYFLIEILFTIKNLKVHFT